MPSNAALDLTFALDTDGHAHLGVADIYSLYYVTNIGGAWQSFVVDEGVGFGGSFTAAASGIDTASNGTVSMVYNRDGLLWHAQIVPPQPSR